MVQEEVGPYLSLKVGDFNSTPSQELQRYWSDKSLDELTEKLKEHKSNQGLKKILERRKIALDSLLSVCEAMLEGQKTGECTDS